MSQLTMLATQVHCVHDGHVLLMQRRKEPNLGLWVAPGGKMRWDESPYECALRELREETGLVAKHAHFRGIVNTVFIASAAMHFLYLVTDFSGELIADLREGMLAWHPLDKVMKLKMPSANRQFLPKVLEAGSPFYQARYQYNEADMLIEVIEHGIV